MQDNKNNVGTPVPASVFRLTNCSYLFNHALVSDDLFFRHGKIVNPKHLFWNEQRVHDILINCDGCIVAPGFIDVQINGCFGIDFANPDHVKSRLREASTRLLEKGVTSFCPTVISSKPDIYHKVLPMLKYSAGGMHGAEVLGAHIEGPFISSKKHGAHLIDNLMEIPSDIKEIFGIYGPGFANARVLTIAPELAYSSQFISYLSKHNVLVSLGHTNCTLDHAENAVKHGASFITHLFNAMPPFHHRDPGLIGLLTSDKLPQSSKQIFYGIISDGIHTHPAALRIAHRANANGLVLVSDAVPAMGLSPGFHKLGDVDVEIKDNGVAVVAGTQTLCGSVTAIDECVRTFRRNCDCTVVEALEAATLHPAQLLGIDDRKGTLNYHTDADFVILSPTLKVMATFIAGECVWFGDDFREQLSPIFTVVDQTS